MSDTTVRISSDGIFYTIQGEGPLIGTPSLFLRLDTCNLRCAWGSTLCDAAYTSWTPGDLRIEISELCDNLTRLMKQYRCRYVVLTGGEPFLQERAVSWLSDAVYHAGGHITIETNGTWYLPTIADLICLSPKLKSSTPHHTLGKEYRKLHQQNRWKPDAIKRFMAAGDYYFKFVVDAASDLPEILEMFDEVEQVLPDPEHVVLMPQGVTPSEIWSRSRMVADLCKRIGARFSPRIQIDIWGNTPGT